MSGMNSIGACPFEQKMEFSDAVAVMDKTGRWEEGQEDENQIGARLGACMWIHTKATILLTPKDMENFRSKLHLITEAVNKTWDFLCGTHVWTQQELHGT